MREIQIEENTLAVKAIPESELLSTYGENSGSSGKYLTAIFFSFTVFLPVAIIPFFGLILKSHRVKVRYAFHQPKSYSTLAACIGIGFWFSIFAVVMDFCACVWAFGSAGQENILETIEGKGDLMHITSLRMLIVTAVIDGLAFVIGIGCIITAYRIAYCKKCGDWLEAHNIINCCLCPLFCIAHCLEALINCCLCPLFCKCSPTMEVPEKTMWYLCASFIAPLVCFGSHFGYILVGWLTNPVHGGAVFVIYAFSFMYYLVMFKMVYNATDDKVVNVKASNEDRELKGLASAHRERHVHEFDSHEFSLTALLAVLFSGFFFAGIEVYVTAAFAELPIIGATEQTPQYLLSLFQVTLVVATIVLTYKYLTADAPVERDLLVSLIKHMKYYRKLKSSTPSDTPPEVTEVEQTTPPEDTEVEQTAAILGAIAHNFLEQLEEGRGDDSSRTGGVSGGQEGRRDDSSRTGGVSGGQEGRGVDSSRTGGVSGGQEGRGDDSSHTGGVSGGQEGRRDDSSHTGGVSGGQIGAQVDVHGQDETQQRPGDDSSHTGGTPGGQEGRGVDSSHTGGVSGGQEGRRDDSRRTGGVSGGQEGRGDNSSRTEGAPGGKEGGPRRRKTKSRCVVASDLMFLEDGDPDSEASRTCWDTFKKKKYERLP